MAPRWRLTHQYGLISSCGDLLGVLFGYLPARNASKLQPTESLRYE